MLKSMKKKLLGMMVGGTVFSISLGMGGCTGGIIDQLANEVCAEVPELCEGDLEDLSFEEEEDFGSYDYEDMYGGEF